jgi:hypothetical protein
MNRWLRIDLMKSKPLRVILAITVLWAGAACRAQETKTPQNSDLAAANQLYQAGKFSEAIQKYQLKANPTLIPAQAGLIRSYLHADQVDPAYDLARRPLAANPNSAPLLGWPQMGSRTSWSG